MTRINLFFVEGICIPRQLVFRLLPEIQDKLRDCEFCKLFTNKYKNNFLEEFTLIHNNFPFLKVTNKILVS